MSEVWIHLFNVGSNKPKAQSYVVCFFFKWKCLNLNAFLFCFKFSVLFRNGVGCKAVAVTACVHHERKIEQSNIHNLVFRLNREESKYKRRALKLQSTNFDKDGL